MTAAALPLELENRLARLAQAAYEVALKQGFRKPFIEVELEIWQQIQGAYRNLNRDSATRASELV